MTSLVFDHALRIRLKAETAEKKEGATESAPPSAPASETGGSNTPDTASAQGDEEADADTLHSRSATAVSTATTGTSSTATVTAPAAQGKAADSKKAEPPKAPEADTKGKKGNLVGKINNLVTSDLDNITTGRDFLFICESSR